MRFRRLSQDELFSLETEFKQFLVIHEQYDEEWRKLASEHPEKAEQFIELFSDLVLAKIYSDVSFLIHFSSNMISFFDVRNDPMHAYHVKYTGEQKLNKKYQLKDLLADHFDELAFYRATKIRSKEKEDEVHDLIEKGCELSDEKTFQQFKQLFDGK